MATPSSSYDVVILGSGIAGLAGALAAHELGLKPVVLEKAAALGGGTVHSLKKRPLPIDSLFRPGRNHPPVLPEFGCDLTARKPAALSRVRYRPGGRRCHRSRFRKRKGPRTRCAFGFGLGCLGFFLKRKYLIERRTLHARSNACRKTHLPASRRWSFKLRARP